MADKDQVERSNDTFDLAATILLSIEEGVTIYDQDLRLMAWNDRYAAMGITPHDKLTIGLHIDEVYRIAAEAGVFGSGDPSAIAKHRISQVRAKKSPECEDLNGLDGRIIEIRRYFLSGCGVAAVFTDVTALRQSQSRLRRAEQLELLGRAIAGFAHDMNNHLCVVSGQLELAESATDASITKQMISRASLATANAVELTRSILDLANPRGMSDSINTRFEVMAAVRETVKWCRLTIPSQIEIQCDQPDSIIEMEGNRARFCSCLFNLLLNAQDALPRSQTIHVTCGLRESSHNQFYLCVADDGHGIPEEIINQVAEAYFTTKGGDGTGMGLYEVATFASTLGGCLKIVSQPGIGTEITLHLPVAEWKYFDDTVSAAAEESITEVCGRVLIVEDSPTVLATIQECLSNVGAQTFAVRNGEDALDLINSAPELIDVIIADFDLSGRMTGVDLAASVHADQPDMPFLLCTARKQLKVDNDTIRVLQKPVRLIDLLSWLRSVIEPHAEVSRIPR